MLTKIALFLFAAVMAWRLLRRSLRPPSAPSDRPRLEADEARPCAKCGTWRLPGPQHRCEDPDCP